MIKLKVGDVQYVNSPRGYDDIVVSVDRTASGYYVSMFPAYGMNRSGYTMNYDEVKDLIERLQGAIAFIAGEASA